MGSVDVQSSLASWDRSDSSGMRGVSADMDVRISVGGGRYRGRDPVNAFSLGATLPFEVLVPFFSTSAFHVSVFPGLGFGRVASFGDTESGILPMIGGSIGWTVNRAFDVSIGAQRVILSGGATQIGAAVVWRRGARGGGARP